ncbi:hypothetical protein K1T71_013874 [Dendrolimus kikuchii]|uniref:Uncharacterized protein n=1 Tax=Dendrolimus kikuchii TaxID=765133 RepID=A0ACC1CG63_9NEOP|nr:hypothetical protein K1T71_013874 [Dendrolimus kikuchii]
MDIQRITIKNCVASVSSRRCASAASSINPTLWSVKVTTWSQGSSGRSPTGHISSKTLGQRSWIYRYPKTFQLTFTTLALSIFFSKPIYDIFFRPQEPFDFTEPPTTHHRLSVKED